MMLRLVREARRAAASSELVDRAGARRWLSTAMKGRLEGKTALITGGASGLGKATAHEFIQEGACVVLADINSQLGLQTAEELGPQAHFIHCDVVLEDSVAEAVDAAVAMHGRLDVMFNSAGVVGSLSGTSEMATLDLDQFDDIMRVNLRGTLAGIKHATRFSQMLQGADEATVTAIIRSLGELKGAACEAVDVARAAVYLASDDGKYVSGQNLVVDGGFTTYKYMNVPFPKPQDKRAADLVRKSPLPYQSEVQHLSLNASHVKNLQHNGARELQENAVIKVSCTTPLLIVEMMVLT
uniref:Sex determination protein tasselseed-2 n=1 Tax=Aegilops tauschii TaxID=37682 RepID=M8CWH2_AEGTA